MIDGRAGNHDATYHRGYMRQAIHRWGHLFVFLGLLGGGCATQGPKVSAPLPGGHPRVYVAGFTGEAVTVDGRLDEACWPAAPWTEDFIDIEGASKPKPTWRTRAKMCWDNTHFYVAAEMDEPHLWGTLTERDSIIYHDNDFEIFIDPDGDRAAYDEYEINVLGTEMDLRMSHPYRDGGSFDLSWDFEGVRSAVAVEGTINDPSDRDTGWTVEVAIPWSSMADTAGVRCPPRASDTWHVNFSRVQWPIEVVGGGYVKPEGVREDNWVWSPQYAIDMHRPEYWGLVQFAAQAPGHDVFQTPDDVAARAQLRSLKQAIERYGSVHGQPPAAMRDLDGLWTPDPALPRPTFEAGPDGRMVVQRDGARRWVIDSKGRIHAFSQRGGDSR